MDHIFPDAVPHGTEAETSPAPPLAGHRVAFAGRLSAMPRREAMRLVRQHGGVAVELTEHPTLVVWGDDASSESAAPHAPSLPVADAPVLPDPTKIAESELWQRLGMVDDCQIRRLYTPAMLAELLCVPVAWVRRWTTRGLLLPVRRIHRLAYFDFEETVVAGRLAKLQLAGCTLQVIERRLGALRRHRPDLQRPLAEPSVVVEGRRILWRRDEDLAEPHGQLLLDFDHPEEGGELDAPQVVHLGARCGETFGSDGRLEGSVRCIEEQLEREASDWEEQGDYHRAAETYRALLMACGPSAEVHFALAEALYRSGDLGAARERYYAALECDEEFVEARANLGCVLSETDELELAVATFEGALRRHPDFADVHFHLADTWDRLGDQQRAAAHFRSFLALAPESPWASTARDRLARAETSPIVGVIGPQS